MATPLPQPGQFIRRDRDGAFGRVLRLGRVQRSAGWAPLEIEVEWLDEWTHDVLTPESPRSPRVTVLDGQAAAQVAAAFASLTCPACGGTGLKDPRRGRYDDNRCSNPACHSGRRTGVRPGFDASFADYLRHVEARRREEARYERPGTRAAAPAGATDWRRLKLQYTSACVVCRSRLVAGAVAEARKVNDRWETRCPGHGQAGA